MKANLNICTVVVTFNRKELLLRNLESQFSQTVDLNHIVIVDNNSNDGTEDFLKAKKVFEKKNVVYCKLNENIGGAGGFEFGVKKACELGAEIICLMDDDGYAINNTTFESVMTYIEENVENKQAIFINSMVLADEENLTFPYEGIIKTRKEALDLSINNFLNGHGSPFNATFINRPLVDKIGFPRGDFFIRYDEIDYFLKAKQINACVGVVTKSLYYHPKTCEYEEKKFLGKQFINDYEKSWKEYYKTRNNIILYNELGVSKLKLLKSVIKRVIGIYIFDVPDKTGIIKNIVVGTKDAFMKKAGKTISPN